MFTGLHVFNMIKVGCFFLVSICLFQNSAYGQGKAEFGGHFGNSGVTGSVHIGGGLGHLIRGITGEVSQGRKHLSNFIGGLFGHGHKGNGGGKYSQNVYGDFSDSGNGYGGIGGGADKGGSASFHGSFSIESILKTLLNLPIKIPKRIVTFATTSTRVVLSLTQKILKVPYSGIRGGVSFVANIFNGIFTRVANVILKIHSINADLVAGIIRKIKGFVGWTINQITSLNIFGIKTGYGFVSFLQDRTHKVIDGTLQVVIWILIQFNKIVEGGVNLSHIKDILKLPIIRSFVSLHNNIRDEGIKAIYSQFIEIGKFIDMLIYKHRDFFYPIFERVLNIFLAFTNFIHQLGNDGEYSGFNTALGGLESLISSHWHFKGTDGQQKHSSEGESGWSGEYSGSEVSNSGGVYSGGGVHSSGGVHSGGGLHFGNHEEDSSKSGGISSGGKYGSGTDFGDSHSDGSSSSGSDTPEGSDDISIGGDSNDGENSEIGHSDDGENSDVGFSSPGAGSSGSIQLGSDDGISFGGGFNGGINLGGSSSSDSGSSSTGEINSDGGSSGNNFSDAGTDSWVSDSSKSGGISSGGKYGSGTDSGDSHSEGSSSSGSDTPEGSDDISIGGDSNDGENSEIGHSDDGENSDVGFSSPGTGSSGSIQLGSDDGIFFGGGFNGGINSGGSSSSDSGSSSTGEINSDGGSSGNNFSDAGTDSWVSDSSKSGGISSGGKYGSGTDSGDSHSDGSSSSGSDTPKGSDTSIGGDSNDGENSEIGHSDDGENSDVGFSSPGAGSSGSIQLGSDDGISFGGSFNSGINFGGSSSSDSGSSSTGEMNSDGGSSYSGGSGLESQGSSGGSSDDTIPKGNGGFSLNDLLSGGTLLDSSSNSGPVIFENTTPDKKSTE
ncbi:uncharacterized protein isoform X2 [Leptinotarsa decemlineata]|uniref:uncharacterized protein isoform X2 n=1 Tax=Leptinotarsa decemlineata TaxID=7539 RepID=UPI003D307329